MEDIVIDDDDNSLAVCLRGDYRLMGIEDKLTGDVVVFTPESIDKLIEALQKVKEEFNHE